MTRVTLYIKASCSTCLRARQLLVRLGVHFTERDIVKHPPGASEILEILGGRAVLEIFSRRSPSAKDLDPDAMADGELLSRMHAEPRLIRRPLLRVGDQLIVGFDEAAYRAALDGAIAVTPGDR